MYKEDLALNPPIKPNQTKPNFIIILIVSCRQHGYP